VISLNIINTLFTAQSKPPPLNPLKLLLSLSLAKTQQFPNLQNSTIAESKREEYCKKERD
jgi:hypothetical protein